jgi:hypothetical protein
MWDVEADFSELCVYFQNISERILPFFVFSAILDLIPYLCTLSQLVFFKKRGRVESREVVSI